MRKQLTMSALFAGAIALGGCAYGYGDGYGYDDGYGDGYGGSYGNYGGQYGYSYRNDGEFERAFGMSKAAFMRKHRAERSRLKRMLDLEP